MRLFELFDSDSQVDGVNKKLADDQSTKKELKGKKKLKPKLRTNTGQGSAGAGK